MTMLFVNLCSQIAKSKHLKSEIKVICTSKEHLTTLTVYICYRQVRVREGFIKNKKPSWIGVTLLSLEVIPF